MFGCKLSQILYEILYVHGLDVLNSFVSKVGDNVIVNYLSVKVQRGRGYPDLYCFEVLRYEIFELS